MIIHCFINSQLSTSRVTSGAVALFNKAQKRVTAKSEKTEIAANIQRTYFPNLADQFVAFYLNINDRREIYSFRIEILIYIFHVRIFCGFLMNESLYMIL